MLADAGYTTTSLINDSDSLPSGYFISYTRYISHSSTEVDVYVTASDWVDVLICDGGDMEAWNDGGPEPYWYAYRYDTTSASITVTLGVGSYDFVIINWGYFSVSYSISVSQTYWVSDPTSPPTTEGGTSSDVEDWVYGVVSAGVVVGLIAMILVRRRMKRRRQPPMQPQYPAGPTYQTYQPSQTYETYRTQTSYQSYQPQETSSSYFGEEQSSTQDSSAAGTISICFNCGGKNEPGAKFCTLCGMKLD